MATPTKQICSEILKMAKNDPPQNLRMWTGLWNAENTDELQDKIQMRIDNSSDTVIRNARSKMVIFLRILAAGLTHMWQAWATFVLPSHPKMLAIHKLT